MMLPIMAASGQEFSADVVDTRPKEGEIIRNKIYVARGKMRIEAQGPVGKNAASVVIVDAGRQITYLLVPDQKVYLESDTFGTVYTAGLRLLQPVDPHSPCAGFKQYVKQESCKKLGSERVNGRNTRKWEINSTRGGKGYLWVDLRLAFVIRMQDQEGLTELQNIREGPQAPGLFELPAGYRRMDGARIASRSEPLRQRDTEERRT